VNVAVVRVVAARCAEACGLAMDVVAASGSVVRRVRVCRACAQGALA